MLGTRNILECKNLGMFAYVLGDICGWDPKLNMKSTYVSCSPYTHTLKVIYVCSVLTMTHTMS